MQCNTVLLSVCLRSDRMKGFKAVPRLDYINAYR
jgi:hypothetical protein